MRADVVVAGVPVDNQSRELPVCQQLVEPLVRMVDDFESLFSPAHSGVSHCPCYDPGGGVIGGPCFLMHYHLV